MGNIAIAEASAGFVHDQSNRYGLMIAAFPTGYGKTYQNCLMMLNEVQNNPSTKFIFITEQNKNLEGPYKDLKKFSREQPFKWSVSDFNKRVLWLKSNVDMFDEGYKDSMKQTIYDCFSKYGIDRQVLNRVLDARKAYGFAKKKSFDKDYLNERYASYQDAESVLRKSIHKILRDVPKTEKKLEMIEKDPLLQWIGEIYPVIRFREYTIVLMSDRKFAETIDSLVSSPFCIWEETDFRMEHEIPHSHLRDHIIIIDEFDTFKKVLQEHLIEENLHEVDAIRAFRNCAPHIRSWMNLPNDMIAPSKWWQNQKFTIEERFQKLNAKCDKLCSGYRIQYLFKLFGVDEDGTYTDPPSTSFMYRDYEPYTVGTAFTLKMEKDDRYNRILTGKKLTATHTMISSLFGSLDDFFNQLCRLVRDLAFNYKSNLEDMLTVYRKTGKAVKYEGEERSGFINCVDSIIDAFDFDEDLSRYIKTKVLHNRLRSNNERSIELLEPTVYSRGFRYIDMRDSVSKQLQTHLFYTDYDTTPEFILRHMCEVTKVIGMSATGEIESPFCNFSLHYLRECGVHIHELSQKEYSELNSMVERNKVGYTTERNGKKAEVQTHVLDTDPGYSKMSWEKIFDSRTATEIYNQIGKTNENEDEDYSGSRYVRAAHVMKAFLEHDDIQSMICFFSAHAKSDNGSAFKIVHLNTIFEKLASERDFELKIKYAGDEERILNEGGTRKATLIQITSNNFEDTKAELNRRLATGEKILVLSAYQTLAAGQNLQYPIPETIPESELVWVREGTGMDKLDKKEKDFDAIYLDDPKNIGPKIVKGDKKTLDDYLFYIEYADTTGEIDLEEKRKQIGQAFMYCYNPHDAGHPKHFKNTQIYNLAKGQAVVQAIGRADRTGWKRKVTHIFLDKQLAYGGVFALDKEDFGHFRSQIFDEVYDKVHRTMNEDADTKTKLMLSNMVRRSHNFMTIVDDIRSAMYGGEQSAIDEWQAWREFVMKYPTAPTSIDNLTPFERRVFTFGYLDMPEPMNSYHFAQKQDFRYDSTDGLEISLKDPRRRKKSDISSSWQTASESTTRLDLMNRIDGVTEYLESKGYATSFKPNMKLMCPPLMRNIYMGALGEVVGQFLLERDFELEGKLTPMENENYEQFDCRYGDDVIDFKDWAVGFMNDEKSKNYLLNKINRKMGRCKVQRAYVINVAIDSEKNFQPFSIEYVEKGEVVIVPYLYQISDKGLVFNDAFNKLLQKR